MWYVVLFWCDSSSFSFIYIYHSPNQQRWLLNEPIRSPSVHRARLHHVILILEFLLVFIFSIIFSLSLFFFSISISRLHWFFYLKKTRSFICLFFSLYFCYLSHISLVLLYSPYFLSHYLYLPLFFTSQQLKSGLVLFGFTRSVCDVMWCCWILENLTKFFQL